jgi:hypothetical protein
VIGAGRAERPADPLAAAWLRLVVRADRLDAAAAAGRCSPRLVPGAWAGLKLAAMALLSPALGLWVAGRATANHRRAKELTRLFPDVVEAVMAGRPHPYPVARVQRIQAAERWFVASDLHRTPAGHLDWPARQEARAVYDGALEHYARGGWGLIENGDIEDFWLAGGSAYGVSYELGRLVAAALPPRLGRALADVVVREHLRRIVDNYRGTYDRIRADFHTGGRFVRVTGNHDDCYEREPACAALADEFPGLAPTDFVVLEHLGTPVGVVFHGHQTDAWNGPGVPNNIARFTTSLGAALHDQVVVGLAPGLPTAADSAHLLEGRARNRLTRVNGLVGANTGLDSMDEVLLFESFRRAWGAEGELDLEPGPWIILGHTHIPLAAPFHPRDGGRWHRYRNAGSGITHRLVTGVEWDGTADPVHPDVRLVAWAADEGGSGSIRRLVFDAGGETLSVRGTRAGVAARP